MISAWPMKKIRAAVVDGVRQGKPLIGPQNVHIDVTNGCNAACITCWDHSPLLQTPRSASWKRQRLPLKDFHQLIDELVEMGSVRAVVLSGMGEPLTHPGIYEMMERVKEEGWHLTVLSNLLAADIEKLCESRIDNLLVGVHGATPVAYAAFHPGWNESHFFQMVSHLRALGRAGIQTRHVQVINRDTAPEFVQMVRFGKMFGAERINYKLASLYGGTEDCSITESQRLDLLHNSVPKARILADELGVSTNLNLFEKQLQAASGDLRATTPISEVGCFMGYVYTRIAVDGQVLFCCNTEVPVGHLSEGPFQQLWFGEQWQATRKSVAEGSWFPGCDKCGKFEQNVKWSERVR